MTYYHIGDFDYELKINELSCRLAAEHLGWEYSEIYKSAEEATRKAQEVLADLRFLTTTKDEDDVFDKVESILQDEYGIDTDLIKIEAGYYGEPFCCEELKLY